LAVAEEDQAPVRRTSTEVRDYRQTDFLDELR
jgi:hypothetical protein